MTASPPRRQIYRGVATRARVQACGDFSFQLFFQLGIKLENPSKLSSLSQTQKTERQIYQAPIRRIIKTDLRQMEAIRLLLKTIIFILKPKIKRQNERCQGQSEGYTGHAGEEVIKSRKKNTRLFKLLQEFK